MSAGYFKGHHGKAKARNVINNQGYSGRRINIWKRKEKDKRRKRRKTMQKIKEFFIFSAILGLLIVSMYYYLKQTK